MVRLFVSDFDRTLYVDQAVSDENIDAIAAWQRKGGRFAIATGRTLTAVREKFMISAIVPDYWICNNGGEIYDRAFKLLSRTCIAQESAGHVVKELSASYFSSISVNAAKRSVKILGRGGIDDRNGDEPVVEIAEIEQMREIIQIAQKYPTAEETHAVAARFNAQYGEAIAAYPNVVNLDIVAKGVNKATAVAFLLAHDEDISEAIVAGDSYNDLEMLLAYRSYTMESAAADIRAAAWFTRPSVAMMISDEIKR